MSTDRTIAGLRNRIVELRRNLDKVREERDEARAKLRERCGIPGTDKEVVPAGGGVGFVIRRKAP